MTPATTLVANRMLTRQRLSDYLELHNNQFMAEYTNAPNFAYYGIQSVHRLAEPGDRLVAATSADPLVRVHAASLNPFDWHMLTGTPYMVRMQGGLRGPKDVPSPAARRSTWPWTGEPARIDESGRPARSRQSFARSAFTS